MFYQTCKRKFHELNGGEIHFTGTTLDTDRECTVVVPLHLFCPLDIDKRELLPINIKRFLQLGIDPQ